MNWTIIEDESTYQKALNRLEKIFDSKRGDKHFKEAELLVMLIENTKPKMNLLFQILTQLKSSNLKWSKTTYAIKIWLKYWAAKVKPLNCSIEKED